jgi:hypothetical protein
MEAHLGALPFIFRVLAWNYTKTKFIALIAARSVKSHLRLIVEHEKVDVMD